VENLKNHDYLSRPAGTRWLELALLLAGGALLLLATLRLRPGLAALTWVGWLAFLGTLGFETLVHKSILLDVMLPALGASSAFAVVMITAFAESESQRRKLRTEAAKLAGELEAARKIQMGLLPNLSLLAPLEPRCELFAFLEPAFEVGGDLYDYCLLDQDRVFFMVGDVTGKGVPAGIFMAVAKTLIQSLVQRGGQSLAEVISQANREISRNNPEKLNVTLFAGILDIRSGALEYCNAGHHPGRVLSRDGRVTSLHSGENSPICVDPGEPIVEGRFNLKPGDTLFVVTDGVTDAASPTGEAFGSGRFFRLLKDSPPAPAKAFVEKLIGEIRGFTAGSAPVDDITVLAVQWRGV
jgi:serine phosphatase RsbU (regulator of sigma subunit)